MPYKNQYGRDIFTWHGRLMHRRFDPMYINYRKKHHFQQQIILTPFV
jgi:hypothetical protein